MISKHDLRQAALAYLAAHQVMTLATYGPDGVWAAAVFYVNKGFQLAFLSAPHTRHAQQMAANPQTAAAIQEDYRDWAEIKGIQLAGEVSLLTGAARAEMIDRYKEKYTFLAQADARMAAAMAKVNWYLLQPTRLYFIDNSRGLGHRDEIPLS